MGEREGTNADTDTDIVRDQTKNNPCIGSVGRTTINDTVHEKSGP